MRVVETKVYTFDELSDEAKEKARQWWRESEAESGDNFWSECVTDEAVEQAKLMGIEIDRREWTNSHGFKGSEPKIYWSGFCSQESGACFEGSWYASDVKPGKVADGWGEDPATTEIKRIAAVFEEIAKEYPEAWFRVKQSGHYSHRFCTEFDVGFGDEQDEDENKEEVMSALENVLIENARDFMLWIYNQLEREYDGRQEDEFIEEEIKANSYEFEEDGSRA